MAKIYVSPETLKKLSESDDYSKILNRFDINRPEPKKQQSKPSTSNQANKNEKNEKELRRSLKLLKRKLRKIRQRHHIELQNNNTPKKKSPTKPLMGDISKRQHSRVINQPVTFFYTPRKSSPRPSSSKSSGKKNSVNSKYMFDHSSPAAEYESRQVEFGHGRAKSKEWNDEIARKFQKELKSSRRKPDWTDRFALK